MSRRRDDSFLVLLRSVQRQLWLASFVRVAWLAGWLAAACAVAAGFCHVVIRSVPSEFVLAPLTVFTLAALLPGLARRPSLESAASAADSWFEGVGLAGAALDQLHRPVEQRAPMAGCVVTRASRAAYAWQSELQRVSPPLGMRRLLVPVMVVGIGGWVLSIPGASAGQASAVEFDAARRLEPLGRVAVRGSDRSEAPIVSMLEIERASRSVDDRVSNATQPGAMLREDVVPRASESESAPQLATRRAGAGGTGAEAGAARPEPRRGHATVDVDAPIVYFDVSRRPGDTSPGEGTSPALVVDVARDGFEGPVPASISTHARSRVHASPQLRAYVDAVVRSREGSLD